MKKFMGVFACIASFAVIAGIVFLTNQLYWSGGVMVLIAILTLIAFWRCGDSAERSPNK
jgi:hypothetical protein